MLRKNIVRAATGYNWLSSPAFGQRQSALVDFSSSQPTTSADGHYVAFVSRKSDLVPGYSDALPHIYLRDTRNNQTTIVSVDSVGQLVPGNSGTPKISSNGRYVAFAEVINGLYRIYVKDTSTGLLAIASVNDQGTPVDTANLQVQGISDNGLCLFYENGPVNNWVSNPYLNSYLYLHDVATGATTQVPELSGFQGWRIGGVGNISSDGSTIVTNITENPATLHGVHLAVIKTGTWETENISASVDSSTLESAGHVPAYSTMSQNGRFIVFQNVSFWLWDDQSKTLTGFTTNPEHLMNDASRDYSISNDGRYIGMKAADSTNTTSPVKYRLAIVDRVARTVQTLVPYTDADPDGNLTGYTFAVTTGQFIFDTPQSLDASDSVASTYDLYETIATPLRTDITPPTITASVSPQPDTSSWNNTNVTVSFNCSDADSGVATCSSPVTLTNEGANQTITGTATDNAGNTATTTATVNIDKTAPTISYTVTPSPNINGWNQDGVTVTFNCSDNLSGISSCTSPVFLSSEGANQTVTGTATDKAGNTATVTAVVNIDKTAPTINYTTSSAPDANGWSNSDVTVSFTCSDSLSGIDSCSSPSTVSAEGANQQVTGTAVDKAGNSSTTTATLNIDKTAPTIVATVSPTPNGDGWNNTDTTVSFTCSDGLSDIAVCPSPITLTEGGGQIITGTATDKAGNSASTSVMVNIDKTAPTVSALSWLSNPLQQGQNTTLMATVADSLSGISSVSYSINGGAPQTMSYDPISGNYIVTFGSTLPANTYDTTVYATDSAGNTSSGTNDILAVYTTANGYVTGHAKVLPTSSDTLPVALDTSSHPADLVMGFTNVTDPMSGSFDMDYSIKNKQNEFSLSSTSIYWVVVSDSTHASILGQADMTVWDNGVETVTQNVSVRYDFVLGASGNPDQLTVKIYNPGVNPGTGIPTYIISDQDEPNSNLMIHP